MIEASLIEELREKFTNRANWDYFFEHLTKPEWAEPLMEAGLFGEPGPLIHQDGMIQAPSWPPSSYLARVAELAPEVISALVPRIPETDNTRVHRDLIRALVPASPRQIIPMIPKLLMWLTAPLAPLLLTDCVGDLVNSLARAGAVNDANDLLVNWLSPSEGASGSEGTFGVESWEFGHALDSTIPTLMEIDSSSTLRALIALMSNILKKESLEPGPLQPSDGSYLWRSAIEDDEQNQFSSNKGKLLVYIRETARVAAGGDCAQLRIITDLLCAAQWNALTRVAMNLVREMGEACSDLVSRFVGDRRLFDDSGVYHEYITLLRDFFSKVPFELQSRILNWIDEGPETDSYRAAGEGLDYEPPSDDEVAAYVDHWKARRYTALESQLSGDRLARCQALLAVTGRVEHAEYLTWSSGVMIGPRSPFTQVQLLNMSEDELFEQLHSWEPLEGFMFPTREGLGRALAGAICLEPSKFLGAAKRFEGAAPTYVRAIFEAVRQMLGQRDGYQPSPEEWSLLLDLAEWAAGQDPGPEETTDFDQDVGWTNCRSTIAHVIESAISQGLIPLNSAQQVWQVLRFLLEDPQPSPAFEAKFGGGNMDPSTLAINTVRGTAMHAAIRFSLWWAETGGSSYPAGHEVLATIGRHLNPEIETSIAVHSVFGWWYPNLAQYYPEWANEHVLDIFPLSADQRERFTAAWRVYLSRWRPGIDQFVALRPQYRLGVSILGEPDGASHVAGSLSTSDQLLGHHLAWLFVIGAISLDDELLTEFMRCGTPPVLQGTLEYLGRLFLDVPASGEFWERIKSWWETRKLACLEQSDTTELSAFGWWAGAANFDPNWFLTELNWLLRVGIKLEGDYNIVRSLARISGEWPTETLECLRLMEASGFYGWLIPGHREEVRTILHNALAHAEPQVVRRAKQFIDLVAAKGGADFSDILALPG